MFRQPHYWLSLLLSLALALAALITLLPVGAHANRLGYASVCTFTPWSTIILVAVTALNCSLRKRLWRWGGSLSARAG